MNRTLNVIRMQLINKQTFIWIPLIILAGSFLVSIVIFAMIPYAGPKYGGGSQAPLWYFTAVGVQAMALTFPFSQAMSVTRRQFYLGTFLLATMTSAALALIFLVGGLIERATDGWGINGYFFYLDWIWAAGPAAGAFFYFVVAMLFFVVGFWAATIYKRFGTLWLTVVLVGVGLLLVGIVGLVTVLDAWPIVGPALVELGALGLAAWGAVLVVVLAASSFATLRRAVP